MENTGKYVLITGASAGIGYELAKLFAADKYNLVLVGRDQSQLSKVQSELSHTGVDVRISARDLFKIEQAFDLYNEVKGWNITLDILVNNAGQGLYGEFKDTDLQQELNIVQLNISSVIVLTKLFLKDMLAVNQGKILNLASIASTVPGPWQSVYHGTKAFVLSFSEAINTELKETGISVTALLPGATDTDFFNKAGMQESRIVQDKDSLADPSVVAKDGYDALMAEKDKVISGFKNKVMVAMSNLLPDSVAAANMEQQQKPADQ